MQGLLLEAQSFFLCALPRHRTRPRKYLLDPQSLAPRFKRQKMPLAAQSQLSCFGSLLMDYLIIETR